MSVFDLRVCKLFCSDTHDRNDSVVRENFLVPRDIEDPKFGAYSGTSFEERVLRAYSLGMLETKGGDDKASLLCCTYCGGKQHVRDDCPELL